MKEESIQGQGRRASKGQGRGWRRAFRRLVSLGLRGRGGGKWCWLDCFLFLWLFPLVGLGGT